MDKDLRNKILMAIIGAVFASSGFLIQDYLEQKDKKEQFVFKLRKDLYDKGAKVIREVKHSYSELQLKYSKNICLTTYEISDEYVNLKQSLTTYDDYISELQRYGDSTQIQLAKNLREWFWSIYSEYYFQYETVSRVQDRARELLSVEDTNSDSFKILNIALEHQIEELIKNENRIYYSIGTYKEPIVDGFEQYLYYYFRKSIGLQATVDMSGIINKLPNLIEKHKDFNYKEKKLPFMFAEGRAFQAATLTFKDKGPDKFFYEKNAILAERSKIKILSFVIDNDKVLKGKIGLKLKNNKTQTIK